MIVYQLDKSNGKYSWIGTFTSDSVPTETDVYFCTSSLAEVKRLDGKSVVPPVNTFRVDIVMTVNTRKSKEEVTQGIRSALYKGLDQPPLYITPADLNIVSTQIK